MDLFAFLTVIFRAGLNEHEAPETLIATT